MCSQIDEAPYRRPILILSAEVDTDLDKYTLKDLLILMISSSPPHSEHQTDSIFNLEASLPYRDLCVCLNDLMFAMRM